MCLAGRPNYDFEDLCFSFSLCCIKNFLYISTPKPPKPVSSSHKQPRSAGAGYSNSVGEEAPWDEEPYFTRTLLHDPGCKEGFFKPDVFRTVSLGIGKNYAASCLALLQNYCDGGSIDARLEELSANYVEFCKDAWLHNRVRFSLYRISV